MQRSTKALCGAVAFFLALALLDRTPPCACKILTASPRASWRVQAVRTPYSDGTAGHIEGRDCGYLSVITYTCDHGVRLTVIMDSNSRKCWGSIH